MKTATYDVTDKAGRVRRVEVFTTYESGKLLGDPHTEIPTRKAYRLDDGRTLQTTLGEDTFFDGGTGETFHRST